ncbi:MAG: DoxX family protein [Acidimicrobiia bacterium]
MEWLILVGRILFGLIFVSSAIAGHLLQHKNTAEYAQMRGVASASTMVYLSGIWILAGGLSVILGVWTDLGALLIALWCLTAAFMVHHFWTDEGMVAQIEMTSFMKNLSIAGAGIMLFVLFAWIGDAIGLQLIGPLFDINL